MNPENAGIDTELAIAETLGKKPVLRAVVNEDNSSYDLMTDLENIHNVLFARDIPYDGTENMGASSLRDFLDNMYDHPFSLSDAPDMTSAGGSSSASATLS